jgi:hypothetical protein
MKLTRRILILSVLSLFLTFPITAFLCGKERWPVKVATDTQNNVLFKGGSVSGGQLIDAKTTTIAQLQTFAYPYGKLTAPTPPADDNIRTSAERQIWTVDATIFAYKEEVAPGDTDYHIAIKDGANTMIAEIPDPNCVTDTPEPLKSMITQARADFDAHFSGGKKAGGGFKTTNTKVRITGPGLFDHFHKQKGYAKPNGIEIHPVIKIEFLP